MGLIWSIVLILLLFWVLGAVFSVGGSLIHLLLAVVLALVVYRLVTGRNV